MKILKIIYMLSYPSVLMVLSHLFEFKTYIIPSLILSMFWGFFLATCIKFD